MKYNNLDIIYTRWFQGDVQGGQCGIVKCLDTVTKEIKYYIGNSPRYTIVQDLYISLDNNSEEDDIKYIIDWGTKFTGDSQFKAFFEDILSVNHI